MQKINYKILNILTILIILFYLFTSNFVVATNENQIKGLTVEKISNPNSGEGEADGLITGGNRETSYAWAMAARGNYVYIGTNKNIVGSVVDAFVQALVSAGISDDVAWNLINSMTNSEIPRPTTETGGEIFKCDMDTGEIELIYTAEKNVAFRMAIEFDGNLYFGSYCSDTTQDNYIYKIDENDKISVAFTSENGTSLRASCIYDDMLLFGGVDSREELEEGYEDCQKLGIVKKDPNDDTKWDRIADYKDFGEYASDEAVFSNVTSPIWDICSYDGYVWATVPNSKGIAMFKGHVAEGNETPNEYGWYWTEVIGKNNGINNLGLAETTEGYTDDRAGLVSMAATPVVFKDQLYLMNFDNTISAELAAVTGIVSKLAGQDVKPSEYLKTMYTTLNNSQKLWKYDDASGKFEEVEGFSEYMQDNCIEYVWRAETYNGKLYITTMDSAVLYNYVTNLKGSYFTDLTDEEIDNLLSKIDELNSLLDNFGSALENADQIKTLLTNLKEMLEEYKTVADDNIKFYEFVIKYEEIINQIEALGSSEDSILNMAGEEFQELYNRVDWTGLKMYSYIAKTIKNDTWGFDLLRTSDGENFEVVTDSGFGDKYNYGGRSLLATEKGLYVGTANPFYGAQLWRITEESESNPGEEDPGEENPGEENPGEENPGEENPGEENPGEENPGEEQDQTPIPDNPDKDDAIKDFQNDVEDPNQVQANLNNLNNISNLSNSNNRSGYSVEEDGTVSPSVLPDTGEIYIIAIMGIVVVALVFFGIKYFRYRDIK